MDVIAQVKAKFETLAPFITEKARRLFAAGEAKSMGWGGVSAVSKATGIARSTIRRGLNELESGRDECPGRIRRIGGGARRYEEDHPDVLPALKEAVEGAIRGDPESPLLWVSRSQRRLAADLRTRNFQVGHHIVARCLERLGFSVQGNKKTTEGNQHADRDAQFKHINEATKQHMSCGVPVISVDTKKKEIVGDFKNNGKELRPVGCPLAVRVHDFPIEGLGKAAPYGIYDIGANEGWVNVGIDHDTAEFAVNSIRTWWQELGRRRYPHARTLMITADGGGSNGSRVRLWKVQLQKFANETGLTLYVSHFPPGTSKWNKIEHRMFSFISMNWRGKPLVSYHTIIQLIGSTTTETGLKIFCSFDTNLYKTGISITDKDMSSLNIEYDEFHADWNYVIKPQTVRSPDAGSAPVVASPMSNIVACCPSQCTSAHASQPDGCGTCPLAARSADADTEPLPLSPQGRVGVDIALGSGAT